MEKQEEVVKGPLGIMPRFIWHEHNRYPGKKDMDERIAGLQQAIERYVKHKRDIPVEWEQELTDLNEALKNNF